MSLSLSNLFLFSPKIRGKLANGQIFGQIVISPKRAKLLKVLDFQKICPADSHIQNQRIKSLQITHSEGLPETLKSKLIHNPRTQLFIPIVFL